MSMTPRAGLQIAGELGAFIETEALPGTGLEADAFWTGVAAIFARFAPENRRLLAVRDDLGNQAMSVRQVRTAVRESAIMRWLGGLGATAFGDYTGNSEAEENRFLTEVFGALRQDVAAMAATP